MGTGIVIPLSDSLFKHPHEQRLVQGNYRRPRLNPVSYMDDNVHNSKSWSRANTGAKNCTQYPTGVTGTEPLEQGTNNSEHPPLLS